jgi:hypothetical protein
MKNNIEAVNNVRRKLNEVIKKTDEKIVVGWRPSISTNNRKEGETWVDIDGKQWEKTNGMIRSVSKLDGARTPLFCPACEKIMNHSLDTKFWRIRGYCFECNVSEEMKIRKQGPEAWKAYEENIIKRNYYADLKDFIQYLEDLYENVKSPEFILADDQNILMHEKYNVNVDKIKEDILVEIEKHKEYLKQFEEENAELVAS